MTAFSRSRIVMQRYDVSPHMVKWWKTVKGDNGMITRHLSPYEQQAVVPWFRTFPTVAYKKFTESGAYWISAGLITYGTVVLGDASFEKTQYEHRY